MNIRKLIDGASRNLLAKVICLVCALFIYIFHQVSMLDKKTFVVPLELVCDGLVAPTTAVPGYVKVSVRAKAEAMPSVTAASVKASVNVNQYTEAGSCVVPVDLEFADSLLLVDPLEVTVRPESVRMTLGVREERYIPVMAALSGEPKHGYQVKKVSVSPSTVKAVGPEEIVRRTEFIYTGKVNVSGAAANFASEVRLDNINALLDVLPESEFKVTVEIEPAPFEASFENVLPKVVSLRSGLQIDGAVPAVSFKLAGTVPSLENFKLSEQSVVIDCRTVSAPGSYELPIVFSVPSGVSVVDKSLERAALVVSERDGFEGGADGAPDAGGDGGGADGDAEVVPPEGAAADTDSGGAQDAAAESVGAADAEAQDADGGGDASDGADGAGGTDGGGAPASEEGADE